MVRTTVSIVTALLMTAAATALAGDFDRFFTGATMRLDVSHTGTAGEEHLAVDRIRVEGEWPGSRTVLEDHSNLGAYLLAVIDPATQRTVYSRGFSSIYGEWETTAEALAGTWRTFQESYRFPEPRGEVQVVVRKRGADGAFREIFTTLVDPGSRVVDRAEPATRGEVWEIASNGPPATKVDLLILGDGYTAGERDRFRADVDHAVTAIFSVEPYRSRRTDFNIRAIFTAASQSGISRPRAGVWRSSPLGLSNNAFDSERYILTFANRDLREVAAQVPYDVLILLANSDQYGGGGIFNLWLTAAAGSAQFDYLVVHELGHSFAGLADEYYTSETSYEKLPPPDTEPWEPNITALEDPAHLKWGDMVAEGTPIPTPWDQERYDAASIAFQKRRRALRAAGASEAEMDAYFAEVKAATGPMLAGEPYAGKVGAFEGAGYRAHGLYRPATDCIMFTRNPHSFCPVCVRAIERVIGMYSR